MTRRWILGLPKRNHEVTVIVKKRAIHSRLGIWLSILLLRTLHLLPNDILPHVILLPQIKKAPNLRHPLRAQSLREHIIRQPQNLPFALFDDDQAEDGDVRPDDAPADGLALALAVRRGR